VQSSSLLPPGASSQPGSCWSGIRSDLLQLLNALLQPLDLTVCRAHEHCKLAILQGGSGGAGGGQVGQ